MLFVFSTILSYASDTFALESIYIYIFLQLVFCLSVSTRVMQKGPFAFATENYEYNWIVLSGCDKLV